MGREGAGSPLFRPEGCQVLTLWVRGEDGDAGLKRTEALVRPKEPVKYEEDRVRARLAWAAAAKV